MALGLTFQHLSCPHSEAPALPADTFFSHWNSVVIAQSVCMSQLLFLSTANPQLGASLHLALQGCVVAREVVKRDSLRPCVVVLESQAQLLP